MPSKPTDELVTSILNHIFSVQEGVATVMRNPEPYRADLRALVTGHQSALIRLWAVWTLAELHDAKSLPLFKMAYRQEPDAGVRINLVWALFVVDPKSVDVPLLKAFLSDKDYAIQMLTARYLHGLDWLEGKVEFVELYKSLPNTIAKAEALKNIRSFAYDRGTILDFLEKELHDTGDLELKGHLLCAIAYINQVGSAYVFERFYRANTALVSGNTGLALHLANAARYMGRAKVFDLLYDLYRRCPDTYVKERIRASLETGGFYPQSLLRNITSLEAPGAVPANAAA